MFQPLQRSLYRSAMMVSLSFVIAASFAQDVLRYQRVRIELNTPAGDLRALAALGLPVDHGENKAGEWIITDLSENEVAIARDGGFPCTVLIADVSQHYRDLNTLGEQGAPRQDRALCNPPRTYAIPDNFELGSMGGYFTWQEMLDILDAMHAAYPDLISAKEAIGLSHEGRPLYMVKISNAPTVDQDKPEVLYDALHHAREPASLSQLLFYMWHLLENYGTDAEVTYLVNTLEMYFVPCVNPDGYVYNESIAPTGGGMWRKNRRDNGDGTFGVDLNRNYAQGWGYDDAGSSPNTTSDVYRGPSAFSEPETQAMRDLCNAHEFRLALNYHTFGDLLIYPWGYLPSFYTPDSAQFVEQGVLLTEENRYRFGTGDQTVFYTVNGGSDDWMYGEQNTKEKIFSMTPEAGKGEEGFWPPEWRITDICQVNIGQNKRMAHLAGVFGVATDRSPAVLPSLSGPIRFELERLGQESGTLTVSLEGLDNVVAVGPALQFSGMDLLEVRTDSIVVDLDPSITDGETFRFVLAVNNGSYTYRDTLTKVFGPPTVLIAQNGNSLAAWQNNGWGTTSTTWVSPSSSITDSPDGNYPNNANERLTLAQPIDLTDATSATLDFWAKWDLEANYDFVQVMASQDGVTWTPLCGLYTRPGTVDQDEDQPLYDGQRPDWVKEQVSLNDFIGAPVRIRFRLISDGGSTRDGFYFDDLSVTVTTNLFTSITDMVNAPASLQLMPNPVVDELHVNFAMPVSTLPYRLELRSATGGLVQRVILPAHKGSVALNTSSLAAGVYQCSIMAGTQLALSQKLVVLEQ